MLDYGILIEEMEKRMFSEDLCDAMLDECRAMEDLAIYDKEYCEAKAALEKLLSPEHQELLQEAEKTAFNYCRYSITYSFRVGVYTGFEQIFSPTPLTDPYKNRISNELSTAERMKHHTRYYKLRTLTMDAFENLHALLDDNEEIKEHITSVDVAWDDWVDTLLRLGFFLGYRYAMFVCGKVDPVGKHNAVSNILTTEYELGFCTTLEELEIQKRGQSAEDREQMLDKLGIFLDMADNMSDDASDNASPIMRARI